MPYAVIFPGQGAAAPGAGEPWASHPAWSVVTEAEAVLDRPLARLLLEADAAELATTRSSQLAVYLHSLVVWEALRPHLAEVPVAFSGHSLGQVTALVAAGALDPTSGARLAAHRADPRKAHSFARSLRSEGKSDSIDAQGLARYGLEREYAARVRGEVRADEQKQLLDGVQVDGEPARFERIEPLAVDASLYRGVHGYVRAAVCVPRLQVADPGNLVEAFLAAEFSGEERHRRRLAKVAALEESRTAK